MKSKNGMDEWIYDNTIGNVKLIGGPHNGKCIRISLEMNKSFWLVTAMLRKHRYIFDYGTGKAYYAPIRRKA